MPPVPPACGRRRFQPRLSPRNAFLGPGASGLKNLPSFWSRAVARDQNDALVPVIKRCWAPIIGGRGQVRVRPILEPGR